MVSYENEARIHFAIALSAFALVLIMVKAGYVVEALPAMFSGGWSSAIAWMLRVRNMRPNAKVSERPAQTDE